MTIKIGIVNKYATAAGAPVIVCGNRGYVIEFTFDEEWDGMTIKTARFVYVQDGAIRYEDVVFTGTTVSVPVLANTREVMVGVFAGDLQTTTPARIPCEASIRCGTDAPADPTPSQYDQIMQLLAGVGQVVPLFADSVEECTETDRLYVLPDGYVYAYMTKLVDRIPVNQIKNAVDTDGAPYNGGVGYIDGCTIHPTTGADYTVSSARQKTTGYIPCTYGDVISTSGIDWTNAGAYKRLCFYNAAFEILECFTNNSTTLSPIEQFFDASGANVICDTANITDKKVTDEVLKNVAYVRVSAMDFNAASVIAINESAEVTKETVTGWLNTGHAFIPAVEDAPKSRHAGKVCVCFGDSIVGNMASPNDYPSALGAETGMTVINAGFGGCRMSASMETVYNAYSMVKLADAITTGDWAEQDAGLASVEVAYFAARLEALKAIDWSAVDFITIGYGTNDIANFVPVDNADDLVDTTTVLGGLRYALTTILTAYPHLKVLVLTPIYRYFNNEGVDSDEKEWYNGRTFTTWTDGILEVAKEYHVPAVDMYRTLGFNKLTRGYYYPANDGTHPNAVGLKVIAGKIAGKLLSEY